MHEPKEVALRHVFVRVKADRRGCRLRFVWGHSEKDFEEQNGQREKVFVLVRMSLGIDDSFRSRVARRGEPVDRVMSGAVAIPQVQKAGRGAIDKGCLVTRDHQIRTFDDVPQNDGRMLKRMGVSNRRGDLHAKVDRPTFRNRVVIDDVVERLPRNQRHYESAGGRSIHRPNGLDGPRETRQPVADQAQVVDLLDLVLLEWLMEYFQTLVGGEAMDLPLPTRIHRRIVR